MTSKKLGALLCSAPPATARVETPEPTQSAARSDQIVVLERIQCAAIKPPSAGPEVPLQVVIPEHVRRQLAVNAAEEGRSFRSLVLTALRGLGIDVSEADIKGKPWSPKCLN
jgi:hypothetical protein